MATNVGLKFYKLPHYINGSLNGAFTSALAVNGALVYATDSNEVWIGGNTPVCVVKGATKVEFNDNSKQLTIKSPVANGLETTQTLDFKDVASASGVFAVFEHVYNLMGASPEGGVQILDYSGTHYLDGADSGEDSSQAADTLVEADKILDAKIYELAQAVGPAGSVVNTFGGQSGTITVGNGLTMGTGSSAKEVSANVNGYIVNTAGTGNNALDIDSSKVDSDYTIANTTNLATVATVTAGLNTLDVTGYAQGSIAAASGETPTTSIITIKGIKEVDGKIENDSNSDYTINVDGVYNASTNMIATVSSVTGAVNALDVDTDKGAASVSGSTITIKAVQQENGLIKDGGTTTINLDGTYDASDNKIATQSTVSSAIDALNGSHNVVTIADYTPQTGESATKTIAFYDATQTNGVVSTDQNPSDTLYLSQATSASNPIVTKDDLSGIVGAMVYKGAVNSNSDLPTSDITAGWTYVVATAGTYAGKACEVGDMIIAKETKATGITDSDWNVINGENQVTNAGATITAGTGTATTLATVDGTDITAQVNVTAGSATIATVADGVVTITPTVSQAANTGTIQVASGTPIVFAKAATTGAAEDVSITDTAGHFTTDTVQGAIDELYTKADGAVTDSQVNGASIVTNHVANLAVDGTYDASTNKVASVSTVTTAINGLDIQADVQAVAYTVADTTNGAKLTFKGVSETDGIIAQGSGSTELQFAKVATTGAAGDVSYTNTTSGLTATDTQAAIDELNSKITNANITIDGHKGAITTGDGLTDVAEDGGSFGVKLNTNETYIAIDSTSKGLKLDNVQGNTYTGATSTNLATVATVTAALDTLDTSADVQAVAYTTADASNGAKLTFKGVSETNGLIGQGSGSTELQFAKVATTGTAADVAVVDSGDKFTATDVEGALEELKSDIAGLNATIDNYTVSGNTITYDPGNNVAVEIVEAAGKLTTVTANLYWEAYE